MVCFAPQIPEIIIVQCSTINSIDSSALASLTKLVKLLKKRGIRLLLCSAKCVPFFQMFCVQK